MTPSAARRAAYFDRRLMHGLRTGRGWTLRDLSVEAGISNPYLSQLETGKTTNPTLRAAVAIADAFDLPVTSFILRRVPYKAGGIVDRWLSTRGAAKPRAKKR